MNLLGIPTVTGTACAALLVVVVIAEPLRRIAHRLQIADRPGGYKAHAASTPYLGGIAVAVATIAPLAVAARPWDRYLLGVCLAAIAVTLVGLVDDLIPLPIAVRLTAETVAALVACALAPYPVLTGVEWLDIGLAAGWVVLVTNAMNLIDNSDAACSMVGAATAVPLAVAALAAGRIGAAAVLLCLACAAAGFLLQNWPPARMFLGDAGSLFIGFLLGAGTVALAAGASTPLAMAAIVWLCAWVPLTDTILVVISRRWAGRRVLAGATDHIAHRLRRRGMPTGVASLLLGCWAFAGGGLAVAVAHRAVEPVAAVAGGAAVSAAAIAWLLRVDGYPAPARSTVVAGRVR